MTDFMFTLYDAQLLFPKKFLPPILAVWFFSFLLRIAGEGDQHYTFQSIKKDNKEADVLEKMSKNFQHRTNIGTFQTVHLLYSGLCVRWTSLSPLNDSYFHMTFPVESQNK